MTFDEALEELKTLSKNGADTWYGDNLEKRTHVRGHIESGSVEMLIYKLRKEYAPTIEMAEGQAKTILDPEQGEKLTSLLTDETPNFDYLFWEPLTDKQIAQAWLHPETIKVIGENNDTATGGRNED